MFIFDRVFADQEDQETVWDYVSDSVSSFVQGYNVSILAYGQSGAGKSYTMGTSSPGEHIDMKTTGKPVALMGWGSPQKCSMSLTDTSRHRAESSRGIVREIEWRR